MKLKFWATEVHRLLDHARSSKQHRAAYGEKVGKPGLMLVGDQGVYLMSTGKPGLMAEKKPGAEIASNVVVYAIGCNPDVDSFDTWWAVKNASFGGDDGVEYLSLAGIDRIWDAKKPFLVVEFLGEQLSIEMGVS